MTYKLLVVEDSEPIRTRLLSLLEYIPGIAAIDQAATMAVALEIARRQPPSLVILDLHLPDGLGMEIIGSLKQIAPTMLIAVLTLYGESSYRKKCMALGADWFFDKATEFEKLLDLVRAQATPHEMINPERRQYP